MHTILIEIRFIENIVYPLYKTNHLDEEVNCTEPSPSVFPVTRYLWSLKGDRIPADGGRDDPPLLQREATSRRVKTYVGGRQEEVGVSGADLQHHQRPQTQVSRQILQPGANVIKLLR